MTLSGLILRIPEADELVGELRRRLDPVAGRGVPAHVTVLFPFVPPVGINAEVRERVAEIAGAVPSFDYRFSRIGWFGETVIFLEPDDPRPFVELTQRLWDGFPAYPPYGGRFDTVHPHLTIGDDQPLEQLKAAEHSLAGFDPIVGTATRLTLMAQNDDRQWNQAGDWPLSG
ncbi:2'-5' RNA ligase family protein [Microlunatus elymi]|uniref:2'-5' RNA ligase family protein n=1 Tax=Microlunatus elymi TaxID=2596828 RepID=A0A516Q096_9ACTN|nr:2'-5' RNA ligase family protein [Microlunatus elymi]QDP96838.1 2'-5' RNA ligase family protein [Microlunatus elymi]